MNPKDKCTCGQPRSRHRNGTGPIMVRGYLCNEFQMAEAHVDLSYDTHSLLNDLRETNEPAENYTFDVRDELYRNELIEYYEQSGGMWFRLTAKGLRYTHENPFKPKEQTDDGD